MVDVIRLNVDRRSESCWQEGATAGRAGKQSKDCPFRAQNYDFVTWHNGWAMARHEMAKAEPQQDYEEF